MIRVIAGKFRSHTLFQPPISVTRPVQDLVKGAIFSMIQFDVQNAIVLDLFSGSGSIAIEFISRGAMKVIAVEKDRVAVATIQKNIEMLGITNLQVIMADVLTALPRMANTKYDFIFIDPPYDRVDLLNETIAQVSALKLLNNLGSIIIKCAAEAVVSLPKDLMVQKRKHYGETMILLVTNII